MAKKILLVGAGTERELSRGVLRTGGRDVALVEPWAELVEAIRQREISVTGPHNLFAARLTYRPSPGRRARRAHAVSAAT